LYHEAEKLPYEGAVCGRNISDSDAMKALGVRLKRDARAFVVISF